MSLSFIAGLTTARRVAIGSALAASLGLATIAAADEQVTAQLRNGDRVAGRFDGLANNLVYIRVSQHDQRKIPVGDVAVLDLVGGAQGLPETELREARGDNHLLMLKDGTPIRGRLVSIEGSEHEGTNPTATLVVFRTTSGEERRMRLSQVGRLYMGRYPGTAPADSGPSTTTPTPQTGTVAVAATQRWVSTGVTVAKDQQVRFDASGEVQLSPDNADVATVAGSKIGRRVSNGPLPGELAGALVGRVGNGRTFGIGNQPGPLPMPNAGLLYLAVNDDNVDDNRGAFNVTVTAVAGTGTATSTNPRDPRTRRP